MPAPSSHRDPIEDFLFGDETGGDYIPSMGFNFGGHPQEHASPCEGQSSAPTKSKSSNKRKSRDDGPSFEVQLFYITSNFSNMADNRLGEIAKRIGHKHERAAASRKALNEALVPMAFLNTEDRILVANVLVKDTEKLYYFFYLPEHDREVMARMIAAKKIYYLEHSIRICYWDLYYYLHLGTVLL